jgi:type IX secretion system PorP/SprF family membrane protein
MRRLLPVILFMLTAQLCAGQTPAPFRQFFFNPYLFNPGYTGINGYTEVSLVYRKQWANFKDAPTTIGVNVQYPTKKRVALGASIVSEEVVGVRNTSFIGTFAYAVPIADAHSIRFGISGGAGSNTLKFDEGEYDETDPRIQAALQNSFYVDGNFGALYAFKGLRVGFALTRLFNTNTFSESSFSEVDFSPLDNRLYSISYRHHFGSSPISIEPYFLYRESSDKLNAWEGASTVYYQDRLWLGASYHETQGMAFFFGANIKSLIKFSYSYELPPTDKSFINSSSHELHLSLLLGKKRDEPLITKAKKNIPQIDSASLAKKTTPHAEEDPENDDIKNVDTAVSSVDNNGPVTPSADNNPTSPVKPETPSTETEPAPAEKTPTNTANDLPTTKPANTKPDNPNVIDPSQVAKNNAATTPATPPAKKVSKPAKSFSLAAGHYVVAGAFKIMDNAIRYSQELHQKGYTDATIAINPKNNLYYVYIFSSYDIDEARKERNQYRLRRPFHEVWLFTVE